jgi:glycosyltransferase involved in cell wall biosynthesis
MKILFVVEHFYPYVGGAEELFLNLTVSLARMDYDVHVITTRHDDLVQKYEEYNGVKITRVNCKNRFLFTIMSLPEVIRKTKNVDCIHTTSYNSAIPAFLAGLLKRKKVIITFHEVWGKLWFHLPFTPKWKLRCFYLYEWFILKLPFYKYVAVSDFTAKSLVNHGIPENNVVKIYNGLDYGILKSYPHVPPEKFTFCFFGRLGISKGIDILLEATKLFIANHPDATLKLIIPTYPEKLFEKVMALIKKLKLEENIDLKHNLSKSELLKEVSHSTCVIIPSYSEGFCFVAVESAGISIPIISSGKGSLPEVVSGKYLLIDELNAEGIFRSLESAINNEWNYIPPKRFQFENSIEKYVELYDQLTIKLK